jgi:hypothetical protein
MMEREPYYLRGRYRELECVLPKTVWFGEVGVGEVGEGGTVPSSRARLSPMKGRGGGEDGTERLE